MISVQYKAKSGKTQFMPTIGHVQEMIENCQGFCLACGETQDGVEPDARRYKCECCGEEKVYGAENLVLMGLVA
jgi:hypothetical protein